MTRPNAQTNATVLLLLATLAALLVVPDWPHRHLDDPSYWGLIAFLGVVVLLVRRRGLGWDPGTVNRGLIVLFLLGLQLIYIAGWVRFGGSTGELAAQLVGFAIWTLLALRARRSDFVLWFGCVLHAVWDAAHFARVEFIPVWYIAACVAADVGIGAFVLFGLSKPSQQVAANEASPGE